MAERNTHFEVHPDTEPTKVIELPRIIEMSETLDGKLALTCLWSGGVETLEFVSERAALALGYSWPSGS